MTGRTLALLGALLVSFPAVAPRAGATGEPATTETVRLVDRLRPAVVNIQALRAATGATSAAGKVSGEGDRAERSLGSGFILDPSGLVATNAHVVSEAGQVRVVLHDERIFRARVVGTDEKTDLALLRLDGARDLPAVPLGDSDGVKVGESVLAIGNPFGLGHTVTSGIVSGKERFLGSGPYDDFIQTDASINPGNSGGPLFNRKGEVVGISTAMVPDGKGIGFAIPANTARVVLEQLGRNGHVVRGFIGVEIQDVTPPLAELFRAQPRRGALVAGIEAGGPAQHAGLRVGDVILSFDGRAIEASGRLTRQVAETPPGKTVRVELLREGKQQTRAVKVSRLESPPSERPAAATRANRPARSLGVTVEKGTVPGGDSGAVVVSIDPSSPAAGALAPGDLILDADRRPISSTGDLDGLVRRHRADEPLLLRVRRGETTVFVTVEL